MKTTTVNIKRKFSTSFFKGLTLPRKEVKKRRIIKSSILRQAEELRSGLAVNYPSFIKVMLKSHVSSCFWMGLPGSFCKMYMPQKDTYFTLEDENGKEYCAKYLATKTALSGGWRGFSMAEKLSEGDVLVFQLLKPAKFKVYILRKSNLTENDNSRAIQSLPTEVIQGQEVATLEHDIETLQPSSLSAVAQDEGQEFLSEDDPGLNSGNSKHVLFSDSFISDSGIASFEDFQTVIDGLLKKEYNLPHDIKRSYHQLCCSQDTPLHIDLLKGSNPLLIAGSIIETVNVAAAIKSCDLHHFYDELPIWDGKLKSLKILGMEVGFLRNRLDCLLSIASDTEAANNKQQYLDLCAKHDVSANEIKDLEAKLNEVTMAFDKRSDEIKGLESRIEDHKSRFQKQVSVLQW